MFSSFLSIRQIILFPVCLAYSTRSFRELMIHVVVATSKIYYYKINHNIIVIFFNNMTVIRVMNLNIIIHQNVYFRIENCNFVEVCNNIFSYVVLNKTISKLQCQWLINCFGRNLVLKGWNLSIYLNSYCLLHKTP